jgi:aminocarboxymuconate-semialdehyde decarboxylase
MRVIDAHAHIVPSSFDELPLGSKDWPSLSIRDDGRGEMFINGKLYRVLERAYFDLNTRLEKLDADAVDLQVVSPLPELLGHWYDAETILAMTKTANQSVVDAVNKAPERIAGIGMLPWQLVDQAAAMVAELAGQGLKGVHVGSNINGQSVAEPHFYPILAALEQHDLALFVHGIRPAGVERLLGPPLMTNVIGIPQDCASAIASFISSDVLGHFPSLRIGFAHAGGSFSSMLGRMDFVWREHAKFRQGGTVPPSEYIRRFYFDTITYSAPDLKHVIGQFGENNFMAGSDGPAIGAQEQLEKFIFQACDNDHQQAEKILSKNAVRFFRLDDH